MRDRVHHAPGERPWTFLTAHAQVLVTIDRRPDARVKDIAAEVGITERAVQTILRELVAGGYVERRRVGKRNVYEIDRSRKLRHALVRGLEVGALLGSVSEPHALERYRRLVERLPVVVYRCSILTGDWHYVSPAMEQLLGLTPAAWMSHPGPWGAFVHPDDLAGAIAEEERAMELGEPLGSEYRLCRPDGRVVWVRDDAFLVEEDGEPQWHGVLTDITERRELEERLRQSQKLEAVGQLAGGIAHDFNNLLMAISGSAQLALDEARTPDDDSRHELEQIVLAVTRARDLTSRLLAFSRKEMSTSRVLDLNAVVASSHGMLRRLIGTNVELVTVPAATTCPVEADPTRLDQALLNLASNARDAMPDGGKLTITTALEEGHAVLRVADTGNGIPDDVLPSLFEPFFTTKGVRGTGLGLATIRELAADAGGSIEARNVPGAGAEFTLRLPLAAGAPTEVVPEATAAPQRGSETILLAEDDDIVRDVAVRMLTGAGYTVVPARYGSEALELAERHDIDLLLTDVVMPGLSGPETARALRERLPTLPVLFMSGYAPETEGSVVGAELIRKPFQPRELLAAVRHALSTSVAEAA
jgi:two-component system, cell cycle sensor histidine kinase and response regulator CckA